MRERHFRRAVSIGASCLFTILLSQPAKAQVIFGSIVGNVTDQSGAAIPATAVKLTAVSTNDTLTAQTNDSGIYTVPDLTAGTYRVEISKQGFRTFVAPNVLVNQNNVVRVDAQLEVGAATETVEVSANAAILQTDRADVHAEVATHDLENLPQPNRTYSTLLEMVPGAQPPAGQLAGGTNNPSKGNYVAFNGNGFNSATVRIDGVAAIQPWNTSATNFVPSIEAIENINVVTNGADAEQGFADGASVNVRLKSGWFSERSACYLASGRPVITQDTGFDNILPTGQGLFAWNDMRGILKAVDRINSDYAKHSRIALDIARNYFNYDVVLPKLLKEVAA